MDAALTPPPLCGVTLAMELLALNKPSCSSAAASFVSPIWCHLSILLYFVQRAQTLLQLLPFAGCVEETFA